MPAQIIERAEVGGDGASFRGAAVFFLVCRYVGCGGDNRRIRSAVATLSTQSTPGGTQSDPRQVNRAHWQRDARKSVSDQVPVQL
ncbi:hypothetical protein [Streptomyces sp. NPDC050287]|uniref:hypothetical protein n=1 Tax=Streptomyces sp. NPDC050287 TaxID=3365608 RepID=UPI003788059A